MFKILLIALLIFLNCGSDKTPLVEVESDPTEPLWGYWTGTYQHTNEYGRYEIALAFKRDNIVSCCERWTDDFREQIFSWFDGIYAYDIASKLLIISFVDFNSKEPTAYNGGNSFVLWEAVFTKQDTLPDWAE